MDARACAGGLRRDRLRRFPLLVRRSCTNTSPRGPTSSQPWAGLPASGSAILNLPDPSSHLLREASGLAFRGKMPQTPMRESHQHPLRRRVRGGITPLFPFHPGEPSLSTHPPIVAFEVRENPPRHLRHPERTTGFPQ